MSTSSPASATSPRTSVLAGLCLTVLLFGVPLFVGLDRWEMRNDEAIYSYAVQRMLVIGDWLNPRYIPTDYLFVEKPPLKMWLVGLPMKAGVLPRTDAGMRVFDALFGTAVFAYVFLLGFRLAGLTCGLAAACCLFVIDPLLFNHGFRSNNMEAALVLAYAGGLYHAMRWLDTDTASNSRHVWAFMGYFVLGFMTKYIAVAFLPLMVLAAVAWRPDERPGFRRILRDWWAPVAASVAAIAPWFLYQIVANGSELWKQMFRGQVYQRFTEGVDPTHLHGWSFYLATAWQELTAAHTHVLVLVGAALLLWRALGRADWTARAVLLWWFVPVPLISLSASKLGHYLFPYYPPLALAAGLAVALAVRLAASALERVPAWPQRPGPGPWSRAWRKTALGVAVIMLGVAGWTWLAGPFSFAPGDVRLFRNSSIVRPSLVAMVLLVLAGQRRVLVVACQTAVVLALLPVSTYAERVNRTLTVDRPLPVFQACTVAARREARFAAAVRAQPLSRGVLVYDFEYLSHTYFYYLRHLGAWEPVSHERMRTEVGQRLLDPTSRWAVLMRRQTWAGLRHLPEFTTNDANGASRIDSGLEFNDDLVLLVPRLFEPCLDEAVEAGGHLLRARGGE